MPKNLDRLRGRIEAVKDASMFEKTAAAEAALDEAFSVLTDLDGRIEALERRPR